MTMNKEELDAKIAIIDGCVFAPKRQAILFHTETWQELRRLVLLGFECDQGRCEGQYCQNIVQEVIEEPMRHALQAVAVSPGPYNADTDWEVRCSRCNQIWRVYSRALASLAMEECKP